MPNLPPLRVRLALFAAIAGLAACAGWSADRAPTVQHVVVIAVDGLRPDALSAAPTIARLAKDGAASLEAHTVDPPETLPSFTSMVTGLPPARHGVTWNNDRNHTLAVPHLFRRVRDGGGTSALYFGKSKLALLARPGLASVAIGPGAGNTDWQRGAGPALVAQFAEAFPRDRFQLTWIHLREPDVAGHDVGWMTPAYLEAVREADAMVGTILGAIERSGIAGSTAVILTADHGGHGQNHTGEDAADSLVPWICRVPGVKGGATLRGAVSVMDTGPTVLALLRLPALTGAGGRAVEGCLP